MKMITSIRDITNKTYCVKAEENDFDKSAREFYNTKKEIWNREHPLMPVTITWTHDSCVQRMLDTILNSVSGIIKYTPAELMNPLI